MMKFDVNGTRYAFTRSNGEVVEFNPVEISFISHEIQKHHWRVELEYEVDSNIDNLDFSEMSKEELIDYCIDELERRWENDTLDAEPDYQEIIFDSAQENEIWRD